MQAPTRPENETARLASLYRLSILDTPREERFDRITRLAAAIFNVPMALVSLVDANRQWFKSCVGLDVTETSREVSFCGHAILTDGPFVINDALEDDRFADNPVVTGEPGIRFYAGYPLDDGSRRKLGTLCILDRKPRELDADQLALFRDLAELAENELSAIELMRALKAEREARRAVVRSEARSRMFMERSPDWVVVMNREGTFLDVSGATGALQSPSDLHVGLNVRDALPKDAAESRLAAIERALDANETQLYEFSLTVGNHRSEREARVVPLEGDEVLVIVRDVTARRAVEQMKDEFVSVVSHELRTPLTSIHGALGLLASGATGQLPERPQRMLQIAVENTDRLIRLINDILDVERMESGQVTLSKGPTNTTELVRAAVDVMRSMAAEVDVTLESRAEPASLVADADRVVQTLTNLLSNAIKFSNPGGVVRVDATSDDGDVVFRVADQGRGIPAERLVSVFDRFEQIDASDSREKGGTGLGLAICRNIVEQHEGWIEVDSKVGEGSVFTFSLPAEDRDPTLTGPGAVEQSDPKILVCHGDRSVYRTIAELLNGRVGEVVSATSSEEALQRIETDRPSVAILDLTLVDAAGDGALETMLEAATAYEVPIVLLSSEERSALATTGRVVTGLVEKPLEPEILMRAVERALSGTRVARVLLVEDDADLAGVLIEIFQQRDIDVAWASTAAEAEDLAVDHRPDLLVLDLVLPDGDGYGVVEQLRGRAELRHVPLVVYTAMDLDDAQRERLRLGQTEFLTKGRVTPQEFERRVADLLMQLVPASEGAQA